MIRHALAFLVAAFLLVACGSDKDERNEELNRLGFAGELSLSGDEPTVDLMALLDPAGTARADLTRRRWNRLDGQIKLDRSFEAFYRNYPAESRTLSRNRIQERILNVSDANCALFRNFLLTEQEKKTGFVAGLASIGQSASRIIAGPGVSTAVRGVRTVFSSDEEGFNDQLFASLTMQVITDGMDDRRSVVREAILENRRNTGIEEYTVEAAVGDAVYYHTQCSVFAGMRQARDLILQDSARRSGF